MVIVVAVGGFAVWRIRGFFGSHELPTYAGNMAEDANRSDPKVVRYEIFGPAGTVPDIHHIDDDGDPNQHPGAHPPASVGDETRPGAGRAGGEGGARRAP